MEPAAYPTKMECREPSIQPCSRACMRKPVEREALANMKGDMELPSRHGRCPRGFSGLQIAILSMLKAHQQVIAYWQIAELVSEHYLITATEGAVRGALERMYRRGFLLRTRATAGNLKGNRYAFTSEPCPHIRPYPAVEFISPTHDHLETEEAETAALSILEKKDRKNLSISSQLEDDKIRLEALTEEDIKFHWPKLAGLGFGTDQIRQIIKRLAQKDYDTPLSNILTGLNHAEWEMERGLMKDAEGVPIRLPLNWVFNILAKQGYYPRPSGYVSPQEQAELDAAEEQKRVIAAQEQRLKTECDAWIARLSTDEQSAILGERASVIRMPDPVALRNHFRAEIWPKLKNGGGK